MGCEANPDHRTAGAITSTVWTRCKDAARASLFVVAGADHPWPGGTGGAASGVAASNAIDATTAIWAFFESLD
jgi:poly(3-hydroxybutyrate) depolymerase